MGREILTFVSRTMWNSLPTAGLVDELHLVVGSVVLGGCTPIFDAAVAGLTLLEAGRFDGSDNVVLRVCLREWIQHPVELTGT
ncbi:MAG: hypothetical protein ACRDVZ_09105, partial [Jiangellaceae bacterium]